MAPQWYIEAYKDKMVASCPPCGFCALVMALTTLFTVFPWAQVSLNVSRNCFICGGDVAKPGGSTEEMMASNQPKQHHLL